ncbi:TrmB family transcriptional regulator sugar-binding domain-containing protein [Ktedonosporobacter rubrisoli]|uniref:TrmB family transcriptional regulator sugar-binding domain-containing protein n=1 Tax=Ktedonosporobacter rubrisoli TaxID=2509675 RepID=UPI001A91F65C|nr:TrmB family transcriptional regulator sugar-binding domain-containing protein [Ktedonosporobacter rubrisoli]
MDKAIHRLIANAQKTIVVDAWSEDIYLFEEALLSAQERGITVVLIVLGPYRTALRNVYIHKRSTILEQDIGRKFSLLCDYRSALLGSFGGVTKQSALETDHPAVIEVLKNAFYHDLLMQHIEADFGPLLTEKYGEQYQKLLDFYLKEKGWDLK